MAQLVENQPANAGDAKGEGLVPGWGRSPGEGNAIPVFLPGKFHEQRSLVGYGPRGHEESDTDEHACTAQWFLVMATLRITWGFL